MENEPKEIRIHFPEKLHGGVYANNMQVNHTREEFVLDFLMLAPPAGAVTARVVVSPGHMKRMLAALAENVAKYEEQFGEIAASSPPDCMKH
ncbi:MAG: DUF3467 domain-containing protein [Thermodesulfobacteriota bacterium]